jgi:lipopolysaccharide export system permease protein
MRETVVQASNNVVAALVREGTFSSTSSGLTTYAREVVGPEMRDLFVNDARNPDDVVTYIAKTGLVVELDGLPAIVMRDGFAQQSRQGNAPETLAFEQSTFDLAPFSAEQEAVIFKESDRYLPELFYPDLTNFYDHANADRLTAEGHARIAAPLLNIAMAMIAIYAVLGGDFSRRGYARRIAWASAGAIFLRLAAFGAASAGESTPSLNVLQYLLPLAVFGVIGVLHFAKPSSRRTRRRRPSLGSLRTARA